MLSRLIKLIKTMLCVKSYAKISPLKQLFDILSLRFGKFALGVDDYYDFALYDVNLKMEDKLNFLSWKNLPDLRNLTDRVFWGVGFDKLITYTILDYNDFPTPETIAVYSPCNRKMRGAKILTTSEDLIQWLKYEATYPLYGKSAHGAYGKTNILIKKYCKKYDVFVMSDESHVLPPNFEHLIANIRGLGFLFQAPLMPDLSLKPYFGDGLAGLRIVILHDPLGNSTLHRSVIKIPISKNINDNFEHGCSGNMVGAIDISTGEIIQVVKDISINDRYIKLHPETKATLPGIHIPHWNYIVDMVKQASSNFPGIFIQGWDIALTDNGPVILEVNVVGDVDLIQIATGIGYVDDNFEKFVRSLGGWDRVRNRKARRCFELSRKLNFKVYEDFELDPTSQIKNDIKK